MKSPLATIAGNFSHLLLGSLLSKLILAGVAILLARKLGPAGFGIIAFCQAFAVYFNLMTDLGLRTTSIRELSLTRDGERLRNQVMAAKLLLTGVAFVTFLAFSYGLPIDPQTRTVLYLYSIPTLLGGLYLDWIFLAQEKMAYVAGAELARNVVYASLLVLFVTDAGKISMVPISYAIGTACAVIFLLLMTRSLNVNLKPEGSLRAILSILKLSIPLGATQLLITLYYYLDQLILGFMKTKDVVGYYNAPYKIINFGVLVLNLLLNASIPFLTRLLKQNRLLYSRAISLFSTGVLFLACPIGLSFSYFSQPFMTSLFGSEYTSSALYFRILIWSNVLIAIRFLFENYLIVSRSQKVYFKCTLVYFLSNLVLNLLLIPPLSGAGAAIATVASDVIFTLLIWRALPAELFVKYYAKLAVGTIITVIGLFLLGTGIMNSVSGISAIVILYLVVGLAWFLKDRRQMTGLLAELRSA